MDFARSASMLLGYVFADRDVTLFPFDAEQFETSRKKEKTQMYRDTPLIMLKQ